MARKKAGGQLMQFATRAIHAGQEPEPATGAITVPIYQTSTFAQSAPGVHKGYDYSRTDNPTRTALQTALASLESAEYCLAFSSGMGAATTAMLLFKKGDHVVSSRDVYGGTYRLFRAVLENFGLTSGLDRVADQPASADYRHQGSGENRPSPRRSLSGRQHFCLPCFPAAPRTRRRSCAALDDKIPGGTRGRRRRSDLSQRTVTLQTAQVLAKRRRRDAFSLRLLSHAARNKNSRAAHAGA